MSLKLFAAANLALAAAKPTASLMGRQSQNPIASFDLGTKWEICIHKPIQHNSVDDLVPSEAMIWDIDQSHAKEYPETIDLLKTAGKAIICYFNAGAMQNWDDDYNEFPAEAKGKTLGGDYEDEWYVDIRHAKVVEIMKKRLTEAAAIGCDGVDPDNVDAWASGGEDRTGFNLQASDYVDYLTKLADHGHSLRTASGASLLVGQKNAPEIASKLASILDFAVLESCLDWNFCGDFQVYTQLGKPVLQIEYPKSIPANGVLSPADEALYCGEHETSDSDRDFSKVLKYASAQLDGWGQYCGEDSWETPTLEE